MSVLSLVSRRFTTRLCMKCYTSNISRNLQKCQKRCLPISCSSPLGLKRCYTTNKSDRPVVDSTMDEEELNKFVDLSHAWWDEDGELGTLHSMNKLRVPFIRDGMTNQRDNPPSIPYLPLEGMTVVDAGCGGGVLTEPLARLGAFVIGVDAVEQGIRVAEAHLSQDPSIRSRVKYIHGTVEDLVQTEKEKFDAVVSSEVVEHVADLDSFLDSCCQLVKPGGSIFITTINKTVLSKSLAVFVAERVLRLVPPGTHDWEKFVPPDDLKFLLSKRGFNTRVVHGTFYNPATREWSWVENTSVNYALHAVKSSESDTDSESETSSHQRDPDSSS